MSRDHASLEALQRSIEEALGDLRNASGAGRAAALPDEPLPSLLAQCEALCAEMPLDGFDPAPIRTLHHFACSGGTLICKCLAAMPNVTLLSEIDPLSRMQTVKPQHPFLPTDLLYAARVARHPIDDAVTLEVFGAALTRLHEALSARGGYLVLRDHAHSQFCSDTAPAERPTLREIAARSAPVLSVITLRHPLDSWLSLNSNGWVHFRPHTLEEYARRYMRFLDHYEGQPRIRYEDFVTAPDAVLDQLCGLLELPFVPGSAELIRGIRLSGDSGRNTGRIAPRPRRALPDGLVTEAEKSASYVRLCERLGYDPAAITA